MSAPFHKSVSFQESHLPILPVIDLLSFASQVLELKSCATTPILFFSPSFFKKFNYFETGFPYAVLISLNSEIKLPLPGKFWD